MVTVTVRALVDKKSTSQPNSLNLSSEKCDGAQYKQAIRSATDCHGSTDSHGGPRQRDKASPERNTQLALAGTRNASPGTFTASHGGPIQVTVRLGTSR